MTKLKCTNKAVANSKMQFPLIGSVEFDKDSVIEVEDNLVNKFLEIKCGFEFEVVGKKKKGNDIAKIAKDAQNEEKKEQVTSTPEKDAYLTGLTELKKEELNALLSTHPEEETQKLKTNKAKIDYLVGKQFN